MKYQIIRTIFLVLGLIGFNYEASSNGYSIQKTNGGVVVLLDGELLTEYLIKSGNKPVLWPIIGPTSKPMTRSWPLGPLGEDEETDHIHQRSLWLTYEGVSGINSWVEEDSFDTPEQRNQWRIGSVVHREFRKLEANHSTATIESINDWIDDNGNNILEDHRTFLFGNDDDCRWIDFKIKLIASQGDVVFEDYKDGLFGLRVAGSMSVTARKGGRIINSNGETDEEAWGKFAEWVDYHGPIDGETVGIAILSHPSNFRHPTRWHVRTYGLFAANPFAEKGFPPADKSQGSFTIEAGKTLAIRYRVIFHRGDQEQAEIAEAFAKYSKE